MEVIPSMFRNAKKDISDFWVDHKILTNTSIFTHEGDLDRDFLEVVPHLDEVYWSSRKTKIYAMNMPGVSSIFTSTHF